MQLTPHFSLLEFTQSDTATRLGLDNTLPPELLSAAMATAEMMERIRAKLSQIAGHDVPIRITSAYRCYALNRAVRSKDTSDHIRMQAVDWSAPSFGTPYEICKALAPLIDRIGIGQLIHERPAPGRLWVHTSSRMPDRAANRVITITADGAVLGIQEV